MNEIGFICVIKILIELYHFFFHNKMHAITKPFRERIKFITSYQRMMQEYRRVDKILAKHDSTEPYSSFYDENKCGFSFLHDAIRCLPTEIDMMKVFLSKLNPWSIQALVISSMIEIVYLILFVRLLTLLPFKFALNLFIIVMILSCLHALNEKGNELKSRIYPFIDSLICIGIYIAFLFAFGIVAS